MALAFILLGAALVVTAIRGTYGDLGKLVAADFTGGFLQWIAIFLIVGALGMVAALRTPSRALLALIVLTFMLKQGGGFFNQLQSGLSAAKAAPATPIADQISAEAPKGGLPIDLLGGLSKPAGGLGGIGAIFGQGLSVFKTIAGAGG